LGGPEKGGLHGAVAVGFNWKVARGVSWQGECCVLAAQVAADVGDELLVSPDDAATMFYEAEARRRAAVTPLAASHAWVCAWGASGSAEGRAALSPRAGVLHMRLGQAAHGSIACAKPGCAWAASQGPLAHETACEASDGLCM
jgi:hypothetical protein